MEELLGAQDGGHLCLEAALAACDAQQITTALGGAQWRHPFLCVHLLQCHIVPTLDAVTTFREARDTLSHLTVRWMQGLIPAKLLNATGLGVEELAVISGEAYTTFHTVTVDTAWHSAVSV